MTRSTAMPSTTLPAGAALDEARAAAGATACIE